jgi:hypothetical protein
LLANFNLRRYITGNGGIPDYGRWYSRTVLVFWPRSHRAAVLAKAFDPVIHKRGDSES